MPAGVLDEFAKLDERLAEKYLASLPADWRLRGLPPEERVRGLSFEEHLAGLSEDEKARLRELVQREQSR